MSGSRFAQCQGLFVICAAISASSRMSAQTPAPGSTAVPVQAAQGQSTRTFAAEAQVEAASLLGPMTAAQEAEFARVAQAGIEKAVRRVLVERAVAEPLTGSTQGASQQQITVVADKGEVNGRARLSIPFRPCGGRAVDILRAVVEGIGDVRHHWRPDR